jgi:23S rRNA pseudouridine1911/1915/1917 synthase
MDNKYEYSVELTDNPERVDVWVAKKMESISRSFIKKLILDEKILVNGIPVKANYRLSQGDVVSVMMPTPKPLEINPQNILLDILYEDDYLVVVNKPKGMVVHPAPGNYERTLVNALLFHCKNLSGINGVLRPGIVHRIDKDTSGILVVAKTDEAHRGLSGQFKAHTVTRRYTALVHGTMREETGVIEAPIGRHPVERKKMAVTQKNSKDAKTSFKVIERFKDFTLVEASLATGRTHQIRVHMAFIGHPVVGDPKYAGNRRALGLIGQALHAGILGFNHPVTGDYMEFSAPIPKDFKNVLVMLRSQAHQMEED